MCMLCNVTNMVRDVVTLLLLCSHLLHKVGTQQQQVFQIFPYWLTLIKNHFPWKVKLIERTISLLSHDNMDDNWKSVFYLCLLQPVPLPRQIVHEKVYWIAIFPCQATWYAKIYVLTILHIMCYRIHSHVREQDA